MEKIEKLTPEQEKRLVTFRAEWLKVGLCTDPADFDRAEKQITFFYEKLGKKKPMFFRFSSPLTAELGCQILDYMMKNKEKFFGANLWANLWANPMANLGANLRANLWANLRANLVENLRANLGANLGENLGANLRANLWANIRANLWANIRENLGANLGANIRANLWENLGANLGANLWENLGENLWENLWENLGENLGENIRANLEKLKITKKFFIEAGYYWGTAGQMDAFWIAFYKFGEELGVKYKDDDLKLLNAWGALSESACWWMPYENICIISDRPCFISKDENGRLHNEKRMAVEFRDGYGLYMWHGISIPNEWVTEKEKLTAKTALTWPNVEQRRAACELLGWVKVLEDKSLNPKTIDKDLPHIGELIQVDLPDAPKQWFLKYQCGTGRYFAESVNDKTFDTALKANAGGNGWRPGLGEPEDYIAFLRT